MMSRNFKLYRIGDIHWLKNNYKFDSVANAIDELIVLDVSRKEKNHTLFCETLKHLTSHVFIPVSAGGGIVSHAHAEKLFASGADKLVLNTVLYNQRDFVFELIKRYGSQCVVASIDFKNVAGVLRVFVKNGTEMIEDQLVNYIHQLEVCQVGEIYLNSIDKDGTGQGYDCVALSQILEKRIVPIILAGGAGNFLHLLTGIRLTSIQAVAISNLLNFIGDGLSLARKELLKNEVALSDW